MAIFIKLNPKFIIFRLIFHQRIRKFRNFSSSSNAQQISPNSTTGSKRTFLISPNVLLHSAPETWPGDVLGPTLKELAVLENFVDENEEQAFVDETRVALKRLRYEKDHWDNAIELYREIERKDWGPACERALNRVRQTAFPRLAKHLSHVHILDLAKEGFIKPHVDSTRYCGDTVAGLSLLTDSVMRFVHQKHTNLILDLWLKRRSLYILRGLGRYEFTHEILANDVSYFGETFVQKDRRISVICRNTPDNANVGDSDSYLRKD